MSGEVVRGAGMTETKVRPAAEATHTGRPRIAHCKDWFAAQRNIALCGKKLLGIDTPADWPKCVVCVDLYTTRFGRKP